MRNRIKTLFIVFVLLFETAFAGFIPANAATVSDNAVLIENVSENTILTKEEIEIQTEEDTPLFTGVSERKSGDLTWSISPEGHLKIEGSGDFEKDYKITKNHIIYSYPSWYEYKEYIKTAEVNVTNITYMSMLFYQCEALTSVDFKQTDSSNVINMYDMFYNCKSLNTILNLDKLSTSNVKDMEYMFYGCYEIESLDLRTFDTRNVTNMCRMFGLCKKLKSLDLSNFDTSKVCSFAEMFYACDSLETLDLSAFNTEKATSMSGMFRSCESIKTIDLSSFNTENVTYMSDMFYGCKSLEALDLSSFNTENVTDMSNMFYGCNSLKTLDLSSFDTSAYTKDEVFKINMANLQTFITGKDKRKYKLITDASSWIDDNGKTYDDNVTRTLEPNTKLYRLDYDIEYIYDGYLEQQSTIYYYNESKELSAYVTNDRYAFVCWCLDPDLTQEIKVIPQGTTGKLTLYAKMKPKNFNILYQNIEGSVGIEELPVGYTYGQTVELNSLSKDHYMFDGFYLNRKLTIPITKVKPHMYGDIVVYAKWTPNTYSITYKNAENILNADKLPTSYLYGQEIQIEAPQKTCYLFAGWYLDSEFTKPFEGIKTDSYGDLILYAKWVPKHEVDKTNGTVIKEATTTDEGEISYQCKNCTYTETEKIPFLDMQDLQIDDSTIMNTPDDGDINGSAFTKIQARADKTTTTAIRLKWNKVKGADGYKIYGNKCGKKNKYELIKNLKNGNKTTWTQKKCKKGTYYKYIVRAYKVVDGQEITLAVSKTIHTTTTGGKNGNAKAVSVKTDKKCKKTKSGYTLTLKRGQKYKIKASQVKKDKKIKHHRSISYESTDKNVATVSKGVVKAQNKGTAIIYVYAQNGVYKKIKVVVK